MPNSTRTKKHSGEVRTNIRYSVFFLFVSLKYKLKLSLINLFKRSQ